MSKGELIGGPFDGDMVTFDEKDVTFCVLVEKKSPDAYEYYIREEEFLSKKRAKFRHFTQLTVAEVAELLDLNLKAAAGLNGYDALQAMIREKGLPTSEGRLD